MRELKDFFSSNCLIFFLGVFFMLFLLFSTHSFSDQPRVCNLSQTNVFFVGREEHLQTINAFFKKGDRIVFALTGGPGFGKSQIAKKYAHTHYQEYDLIWWIDAQQDMYSQFEKLAHALNTLLPEKEQITPSKLSKEALIDTVKTTLEGKKIKYLLIFDNPETYTQIEKFIPILHFPAHKHVLLTSRNANIWTDKMAIGPFKREESLSMIKATLPKENKEDMVRLADVLSDHPLELFIAVSTIESYPTVTIDKYISMYHKRPRKQKKDPPDALLDSYPTDSLGALDISLRFIEEESKDSLQTLFFMSLLNSKDIPESYIELWLKKAKSSLTADEAIKHIHKQSLIGVSETIEFNVNRNKKLKASEKRTPKMHSLSIHDLIHELIGESIEIETKKELIEKATEVMLEVFSDLSTTCTKKITKEPIHLLHAQKLCKQAQEIKYSTNKLLELKVCILQCLMAAFRDFEAAKVILEEIENGLKLGLQLEPYYRALYNINKGFFESVYNVNYDKAIENMEKGLNILSFFEEYHEEKLRALANLAQYHTLRGEINTADKFIKKGKVILEKAKSDHAKSFFMFNWSFVLYDQGNFEEASNVLDKVKAYPHLAEDSPTLYHSILVQKIELLFKQRRLTEAQKHLKEYEERMKIFFQGKNKRYSGLGVVLFFKSLMLLNKGKSVDKALQYLSDAIKVYNDCFHGDKKSRYQARAHLALGKAYNIKTDFENALKEFLFSQEIYNIVLKEKRLDDVSDRVTS